jgi:hypothetical protein
MVHNPVPAGSIIPAAIGTKPNAHGISLQNGTIFPPEAIEKRCGPEHKEVFADAL